MESKRMAVNPKQMGEVRWLREPRTTVATVVGLVAEGHSLGEVVDAYPEPDVADVRGALLFAAKAVPERVLSLPAGE